MCSDGTSDVVVAFDESNGDELWRYAIAPTYEAHSGSYAGPVSTPLICQDRVIALGPKGQFGGTWFVGWSIEMVDTSGGGPRFQRTSLWLCQFADPGGGGDRLGSGSARRGYGWV